MDRKTNIEGKQKVNGTGINRDIEKKSDRKNNKTESGRNTKTEGERETDRQTQTNTHTHTRTV
jgi:hypothetical protein